MHWIEKDIGDLQTAYIHPIGDLHIGDKLFNEKKFKDFIEGIKARDDAFILLMGDLLDCATRNSVGDIYSAKMNPQEAKNYLIDMLMPIKDKLLGVIQGNHDYRIWKESGIDIGDDISHFLGCPYGREGILLNIKVGHTKNPKIRQNYTIYATHGDGSGRSMGAKTNVMKRASEIVMANIYVIGHTHQPMAFPDVYFIPDISHKKIIEETRYYVNGGSFLEWGGYAESKMLPPMPIGVTTIVLSGTTKEYKCVV